MKKELEQKKVPGTCKAGRNPVRAGPLKKTVEQDEDRQALISLLLNSSKKQEVIKESPQPHRSSKEEVFELLELSNNVQRCIAKCTTSGHERTDPRKEVMYFTRKPSMKQHIV